MPMSTVPSLRKLIDWVVSDLYQATSKGSEPFLTLALMKALARAGAGGC